MYYLEDRLALMLAIGLHGRASLTPSIGWCRLRLEFSLGSGFFVFSYLVSTILSMPFCLCEYYEPLVPPFAIAFADHSTCTRAASTVAANIMLRSAVAAGFPLFSTQMFENLGVQWAGTLLACLAAVMAPIPLVFRAYGPTLRGQSKMLQEASIAG